MANNNTLEFLGVLGIAAILTVLGTTLDDRTVDQVNRVLSARPGTSLQQDNNAAPDFIRSLNGDRSSAMADNSLKESHPQEQPQDISRTSPSCKEGQKQYVSTHESVQNLPCTM
jgi:hypothetical protein